MLRSIVLIALFLWTSCGSTASEDRCGAGTKWCGDKCAALDIDSRNCGTCGAQCPEGQVCSAGACGVFCPLGTTLCSNHCANLAMDPRDCGACGNACSADHAVAACAGGSCAPICLGSFADCDANPATGCEVDLATSSTSCGKCMHDCLDGDCVSGRCQPVALAKNQFHAGPLAINKANVYWIDSNIGRVRVCAKVGCNGIPTTLAARTGVAIAVDETNVYWSMQDSIAKCAVSGCNLNPTTLATGLVDALGIATDGVNVYWTEYAQFSHVQKCSIDGCGGLPTEITPAIYPQAIATDGVSVYFTAFLSTRSCPVSGCIATTSLSDASGPAITVDTTNVYVADYDDVVECAKSGCNLMPTVLAKLTVGAGVAADGTNVYWTVPSNGTVQKCAIGGCSAPTIVATGQNGPTGIAVDEQAVYFANTDSVMRLAK